MSFLAGQIKYDTWLLNLIMLIGDGFKQDGRADRGLRSK